MTGYLIQSSLADALSNNSRVANLNPRNMVSIGLDESVKVCTAPALEKMCASIFTGYSLGRS
jgi:hypothetical protein